MTGEGDCSEPPDFTLGLYMSSRTASYRVCQCYLQLCQMNNQRHKCLYVPYVTGVKGLCAELCGQRNTCDWGTVCPWTLHIPQYSCVPKVCCNEAIWMPISTGISYRVNRHSVCLRDKHNLRHETRVGTLGSSLNNVRPELNPSAQRRLTRFFTGYFASWTVHFVNICVKNQQIHQLFIQFFNYVW
jgi:hypothetical protein